MEMIKKMMGLESQLPQSGIGIKKGAKEDHFRTYHLTILNQRRSSVIKYMKNKATNAFNKNRNILFEYKICR